LYLLIETDAERGPAIPATENDDDDHRSVVSAEAPSVASSTTSKRSSATVASMIPTMPTFIRKKNTSRKPQRLQLASLQPVRSRASTTTAATGAATHHNQASEE
jgi:hypothetical protein